VRWSLEWLPCPHCCYPYDVLKLWLGMIETCVACGELLRPGLARRVVERGRAVDLVTCPWCGATQRWLALERIGLEERRERVRYKCHECRRPFTVEHDPTTAGQASVSELDDRERAWLLFMRTLVRRGEIGS
jgi:hypothetical protein